MAPSAQTNAPVAQRIHVQVMGRAVQMGTAPVLRGIGIQLAISCARRVDHLQLLVLGMAPAVTTENAIVRRVTEGSPAK